LFIILNKGRTHIKLLVWEEGGFSLFYQRLEQGTFDVPDYNEELSACNNDQLDFSSLLDTGLKNLFRLDSVYENGTTERKREVISSMYPEKSTFEHPG